VHRGVKITMAERPNFWEADIHYGLNTWLYGYGWKAKSGNNTDSDLLAECYAVIDEAIATGFMFRGRTE
jgi:hypothetical protein